MTDTLQGRFYCHTKVAFIYYVRYECEIIVVLTGPSDVLLVYRLNATMALEIQGHGVIFN